MRTLEIVSLEAVFSHRIVEAIGWALVHFVWQGAAVALVLAGVLDLLRRASSNARYVAGFVSLALMAISPAVTICFTRQADEAVPKKKSDSRFVENWRVSADGQKQSVLALPEGDAIEDWSADGQWLAVRSRMDGHLYVVKPDGSGRRRLTDTGTIDMGHTGFSPDSRLIVYLSRQVGDDKSLFSLRTISVDGTGDREILGETKAGSEPDSAIRTAPMGGRWSPDGKHLAVVLFDHSGGNFAAIGGNWRLAIIDADGGNLRELQLEGALNTVLPWDGPEWRPVAATELSTRDPAGAAPESAVGVAGVESASPQRQSGQARLKPNEPDGWGEEQDGLRTRLVLLTEKPTVGQPLKFRLEMKNFRKVERNYDPQLAAPFRVMTIKRDKDGPDLYVGPSYQTTGGPKPIKPGETVVLWDDFDAAESFLLAELGNYVVQSAGAKPWPLPPLPGEAGEPAQSAIPPSNAVTVELAPGKLPEPKALFVRMREVVLNEKAWRLSMSNGVFFFTHSPTNLKKDVTTIQLWFTKEKLPADLKLGEGENRQVVDYLGETRLGHANLGAPPRAKELWSEYIEQIRSRLDSSPK